MKRFFTLALVLIMVFSFTACGGFAERDAYDLVKGNLDSFYLGIHDPIYLRNVGATLEEVEADRRELFAGEAEYFAGYAYIEYLTDDIKAELEEIFEEVYSLSKYSVGEPKRIDEKTFSVEVVVYPINIIALFDEKYDNYLDSFFEKYADADIEAMTDEEYAEYDHDWAVAMAEALRDQLQYTGYLDPKTITLKVIYDEAEEVWYISGETWQEFLHSVVYYAE